MRMMCAVGAESESSPGCTVRGVDHAVALMWTLVLFTGIDDVLCSSRRFEWERKVMNTMLWKTTTERLLTGRQRHNFMSSNPLPRLGGCSLVTQGGEGTAARSHLFLAPLSDFNLEGGHREWWHASTGDQVQGFPQIKGLFFYLRARTGSSFNLQNHDNCQS